MPFSNTKLTGFADLLDSPQWEKTFILVPQLRLKVDRWGLRRRLMLPGWYETRMARRVSKRIFRDIAR